MQNNRIIIIGSYLVALVMDTERIPQEGETLLATNFRQAHGGKGSNQAVQAARLHAPVAFIGIVGNDSYGISFIELCKQEQVDVSKVILSDSLPTGAGLIICAANGHNIITIDIGANKELSAPAIDELTNEIILGDVVLIQLEIPIEAALYAAKIAKQKGAVVILNPAPATNLAGYDISCVDYLTPNETEARICGGYELNNAISDEEAARKLLSFGCKNVIITLGENGCYFVNDNESFTIPVFTLPKIIDSTGAGDSFNAALAVALLEGKPLPEACSFANASAGLACTKPDTIPSYPYRTEVEDFMTYYSTFKT